MAAVRGRSYVRPDDVKRIATAVLNHRLILTPESRLRHVTASQVIDEIIDQVTVPTVE